MRIAALLTLGVVSTGLLAGCGKSGGSAQSPPPPNPQVKKLLADLPAQYQSADLENGKLHFSLCRSCHTVIQGAPNTVGPNLYGVFGREAGAKAGYSYSQALNHAGFRWDAAHLEKWLANPQAYRPGTRMTFVGISDPKDRSDLIAYLKVASSGGPM